MNEGRLRAWWWVRQGLDGSLQGKTPAEVLDRSGWARSVGGVGPYLTFFSRAGTSREEADAAVAKLQIHELPSARGCTYVVPAADFALALKAGKEFGEGEIKVAAKLGVTEQEIDKLCAVILQALVKGPLDPDAIRQATGDASRSLGEEGKKKGITTTLPVALGKLQVRGDIRRVPANGRLDQQRYSYALWKPTPLKPSSVPQEKVYTELARKYFHWTGPATLAEFRWFSGLGVKESRTAIEPLGLVGLEPGSEQMMFAEDKEQLMALKPLADPEYALVSSMDAITLLRRDVSGLLEEGDKKRPAFARGSQAGAALTDLPNHAILDRGRVAGLWEYDPEAHKIVWQAFGMKDAALIEAVSKAERFITEQLGDARSMSLDSPKARAPRIAALRSMRD